ncbi:MAG: hypothetical protein H0V21_11510 [Rubrobacter sp.]|nr:hypothetical protein [Rubrobacter sp.]
MGEASRPGRSYERITRGDLVRLAGIARSDREDLFVRKPRYRALGERLICVALCQGAAQHYLDGKNGVKDFDVWTVFAAHPDAPDFPWRRRRAVDFGDPKFGPSPDKAGFAGRHVDLLGRSLDVTEDADATAVLRKYLSEGRTETARRLAEKAVVLLEPSDRLGAVIWPAGYDA